MHNLTAELTEQPGQLARLGETLGQVGISLEGGGVFSIGDRAIANFLVADGERARSALTAVGIRVTAVREVIAVRLRQGRPGQLGQFARLLANAGVNIEVQYSDHANQLILVVDDFAKGQAVAHDWRRQNA